MREKLRSELKNGYVHTFLNVAEILISFISRYNGSGTETLENMVKQVNSEYVRTLRIIDNTEDEKIVRRFINDLEQNLAG